MGNFADRFINLAHELGLDDGAPITETDWGGRLRPVVEDLMNTDDGRLPGGTIYLRPGRWLFGGTDPIVLPPEIRLIVAPGAVIVPLNPPGWVSSPSDERLPRPALEIHGHLDVAAQMFISTAAFEASRVPRSVVSTFVPPPLDVGWISFPSKEIEVLYPEWWGAGAFGDEEPRPAIDTAALEAALRSALLRAPWSELNARGSAALTTDPLAVEVRTQVRLDRGVVVGRSWVLSRAPMLSDPANPESLLLSRDEVLTPSVGGLVLRGRRDASVPQIVGRHAADDPQVALLVANVPDGLTLRDLWVDTGVGFLSDLAIVLQSPGGSSVLDVIDCTFSGAAQRLVWSVTSLDFNFFGAPTSQNAALAFSSGVWESAGGPNRLNFFRCQFRPPPWQPEPAIALSISGASTTVTVRGSTFAGEARAMIALTGGALEVYNSRFDNRAFPWTWLATERPERPATVEQGLDVLVWGVLIAPVRLNLTNCWSTSAQFLSMRVESLFDLATGQRLSSDKGTWGGFQVGRVCEARVVNLHQWPQMFAHLAANVGGLASVGDDDVPAPIVWGSIAPNTFALTVVGGCIEPMRRSSEGRPAGPSARVAVAVSGSQRIYDAWLLPPGSRYHVWNSSEACTVVSIAARTL